MFQKFKDKSDIELVLLYKKSKQEDLEHELISRYQKHSKKLAGLLFKKFKFLYQVEYDDIFSIILASLFIAIKRVDKEDIDFYQYWKSTATNEAITYISRFSQSFNELFDPNVSYSDERQLAGYLKEQTKELKDDYLSSFELDELFSNPKNKFSKVDIDVFRLYLGGYAVHEISSVTGISYSKIRYRITTVKRKIANILFNQ